MYWMFLVSFLIPIGSGYLFYKRGNLIWIVPIVYLQIELLVTFSFFAGSGSLRSVFPEAGEYTAVFFPISSAWSIFCSVAVVLLRKLKKQKMAKEGK